MLWSSLKPGNMTALAFLVFIQELEGDGQQAGQIKKKVISALVSDKRLEVHEMIWHHSVASALCCETH